MEQNYSLSYGRDLPQYDVAHILGQDLFLLENIGASVLAGAMAPLKFSAMTCVLVCEGHAEVDINLIRYKIEAPAMVYIRKGHILQVRSVSDDINVSCTVLSDLMVEQLLTTASDSRLLATANRVVIPLASEHLENYRFFYAMMRRVLDESPQSTSLKAALHAMLAFFYSASPFQGSTDKIAPDGAGRISDSFLALVQRDFRKSRTVDYYAAQLSISSKHLSRVVKQQTGYSPSKWIEQFVVLEAKVLLRSSSMSVQQIALDLGFPSQSFFGKYFKKSVGTTPRHFRDSCYS